MLIHLSHFDTRGENLWVIYKYIYRSFIDLKIKMTYKSNSQGIMFYSKLIFIYC